MNDRFKSDDTRLHRFVALTFLTSEVTCDRQEGACFRSSLPTSPVVLALVLCLCVFLSACVGATRLPTRSRGQAGEQLRKDEIDFRFLENSVVHREDIANKLARIDTGCRDPQLFWGRWAESKWGYWWMVAGNNRSGGVGDAKRTWHMKNLLVTFDEKGVLQNKQFVEDDRVLWQQLHEDIAAQSGRDLSSLGEVGLTVKFGPMILTPSGIEVVLAKGKVLITPEKLVRFSHAESSDKHKSVDVTCHKFYFSEKTAIGDNLGFCSSAAQVVTIFQYLHQAAPKGMRWE